MNNASLATADHPGPLRAQGRPWLLLVGAGAPPVAWLLQLLISYGVSSNSCSNLQARGGVLLIGQDTPQTVFFLLIALAALFICIAAGASSALNWLQTRPTTAADVHRVLSAGEGRTRFLALCGMLAAIGFGIGILFNLVEPLMAPPCWMTRP